MLIIGTKVLLISIIPTPWYLKPGLQPGAGAMGAGTTQDGMGDAGTGQPSIWPRDLSIRTAAEAQAFKLIAEKFIYRVGLPAPPDPSGPRACGPGEVMENGPVAGPGSKGGSGAARRTPR